ncbi:MAG: acyl-CoA dehydrogenase family protein [Candidatus Xenobia bacterium]
MSTTAPAFDAMLSQIAAAAPEHDHEARFPIDSIQALRKSGLLGLTVPRELGGQGEGPSGYARVLEQLGSADSSVAMIFMMHVCATEVIKQSSMPNQDELLRKVAAGEHLSTLAFSEKGSRSHFWVSVAQATNGGGQHRVEVEKSFVTTAGHADSYLVSIKAIKAQAPTDSSIYFVEKNAPGVTVSQPWNGLGLRANASSPMRFATSLPASTLVSPEGGGFNTMLSVVLPWFQLGSAAVANGIAKGALEATIGHLKGTKFEYTGEGLSSLPTLRARLAAAQVQLDASRALTQATAQAIESPSDITMLRVLEVKACAGETALAVTDAAMKMCGGAAFAKHLPVERFFRDARACSVMAPTTDVLYEFIGKSLLDIPLF